MSGSITYIDPTAPSGGNGSLAHPLNDWRLITPGSTQYLQKAGTTYHGVLYLGLQGSASSPIAIGSYGSGAAPVVNGIVDVDANAKNIKISGFSISSPNGAGVAIQNGSSNIELSGNTISNSLAGIWIGNSAGTGINIHDNIIHNSVGEGIGIDSTLASASNPTIINHNTIDGSGSDGINVTTNYAMITNNTIFNNGLSVAGGAGIHLWGGDPVSGRGDFNAITGNIVYNNHDYVFLDGEGILLDRNVSGNTVSNNLAVGNDSAGIAVYDSSYNTISNNTLIGNGTNFNANHPIRAQLWLADDNGMPQHNNFTNNVLIGTSPSTFGAFMDGGSQTGANKFSGNVIEDQAGLLFDINGVVGNISAWNSLLGASDRSSGVPLSAPGSAPYNYTFPAHTTLPVDGATVQLTGWSSTHGLFGT